MSILKSKNIFPVSQPVTKATANFNKNEKENFSPLDYPEVYKKKKNRAHEHAPLN